MDDAGIPNFDAAAIYARVRENRDALDACQRHSFDEFPLEAVRLGAKITCKKCDGVMHLTEVGAYIRGYEAAGKDGNDILPGWRPKTPMPTTEPIKRKFFGLDDE